LQVDPRFVDAHIDLTSALFAKGELEEAKAHYLEATRLDPKLAQPHNYLGKIFMREGDAPQAIAQFEQALHLHPDFPEADENLRLAKAGDLPSQTPPVEFWLVRALRRHARSRAAKGHLSGNDG